MLSRPSKKPQYIQFGGIIGLSDHLNDNKLLRLSHK